ncbi:MAG TPA: glycosyltransferase [Chloroflexi bacterium]|nr:glycosyltransferase [Chloroflexota bacterium]
MKRSLRKVEDYRGIAPPETIEALQSRAAELRGATVAHVNATNYGGGVAEILDNFVLLMNDLGIRTDWRVIHGIPEYFEVTKKFHNALQGQDLSFSREELSLYLYINEKFAQFAFLDHDFVIIHDPQPCALVQYVAHDAPWIWRCHIDITRPNPHAWGFMEPFILQYDRMVVSSERYKVQGLAIPQDVISPSIDPLSPKNMDLDEATLASYLKDHKIPTDKPLITQVSRFDPWKDPQGVLKVFHRVRQQVDCRLSFVYNMASDDPEGEKIYAQMQGAAKEELASGEVLFVRGDDPILVNVMQRVSDVVIQKSTREGFGLVITEAMWKGTPVVASNVGGIPTQIIDGETGFLLDPLDYDGFAERIVQLLEDRALAEQIGAQAREHVRRHFLVMRHLLDYLELFLRSAH